MKKPRSKKIGNLRVTSVRGCDWAGAEIAIYGDDYDFGYAKIADLGLDANQTRELGQRLLDISRWAKKVK